MSEIEAAARRIERALLEHADVLDRFLLEYERITRGKAPVRVWAGDDSRQKSETPPQGAAGLSDLSRLRIRALAFESSADERTVVARLKGKAVRGIAGLRVDAVLAKHGFAPGVLAGAELQLSRDRRRRK